MNMLDKYVNAVGKNLPRRVRADIEAEIRSTLEDMLEDRSQETGRPVDDGLISDLLREYGAPKEIAATYLPQRSLIGPRLYPAFELVTKIVLTVLFIIAVVGFGISFATTSMTGPAFIEALREFGLGFVGGAISAFGNIVIIFAVLERTLPASEFDKDAEDWDPAELAREPDPHQVSNAELLFSTIFIVAGLTLLNLYPQVIGLHFVSDGDWYSLPALSAEFFRYLPWINLLGVLEIVLNFVLFRQQIWQPITRLFKIGLEAGSIAIAVSMLRGPSLLSLNVDALRQGLVTPNLAETLLKVLEPIVPVVLLIVVIMSGIEIAQMVFKLFQTNYKTK